MKLACTFKRDGCDLRPGSTLLELLLALSLAAVLLGAVFAAVISQWDLEDHCQRIASLSLDRLALNEAIRNDLSAIQIRGGALNGQDNERMRFRGAKTFCLFEIDSAQLHSATNKVADSNTSSPFSVAESTYVCWHSGVDDAFFTSLSASSRLVEATSESTLQPTYPVRTFLSANHENDVVHRSDSREVTNSYSGLEFSYYDGISWHSSWATTSALPRCIKVIYDDQLGRKQTPFIFALSP